jgi:transposase-like protein
VVGRLKEDWQGEYDRWQRRDLSARHYVYVWADRIYLQARMEDDAACMLVIVGATPEGRKELVGFHVGVRESAQSWRELLVDLKARGLSIAPEIAVGDGAMGFWKALEEIFPSTRHQRCWVHKLANSLPRTPIRGAEQGSEVGAAGDEGRPARGSQRTRPGERRSRHRGLRREVHCQVSQGSRVSTKDRGTLLTFFDFPAEHWDHLGTSNPIESVFATVRHRTVRTKGALSQKTARLMVFKLARAASKTWRRLKGENRLPMVIAGVKFTDVAVTVTTDQRAA